MPAGITVQVCKVGRFAWKKFETTAISEFSSAFRIKKNAYVFRKDGWLLRINKGFVRVESR